MVLEAWLKYYFALRNKKKYVKIIINTEKVEKFQVSSLCQWKIGHLLIEKTIKQINNYTICHPERSRRKTFKH
jgi:hypothetical protein